MESYKSARDAARKELSRLAIQREQIDRRIAQLKKIIEDITPLLEGELETAEIATLLLAATGSPSEAAYSLLREGKITDAIKQVFVLNDSLTPVEVRDQLTVMGFDLTKHNNPMANIHSVLNRLDDQGWLVPAERKDGKAAYKRAGAIEPLTTAQVDDALQRMSEEMKGKSADKVRDIARAIHTLRLIKKRVGKQESLDKVLAQARAKVSVVERNKR